MNLNTITRPNTKGQIVIPKKFREELGIDENVLLNLVMRGRGVYITLLNESSKTSDSRNIALTVLRNSAGAWRGDDWEKTKVKRGKIEATASKKRKNAW